MRSTHKPRFFLFMGCIGLFASITGFFPTFIKPSFQQTFTAPVSIYIHGTACFLWVLLFFTQSLWAYQRNFKRHIRWGKPGTALAFFILATMPAIGVYSVQKEFALTNNESAYSVFLGTIISGILFTCFVIAAIVKRKNVRAHKRWLTLATIIILWPAWFRFRHYFPNIPNPEIWFALVLADSFILMAWAWDYIRNKTIHPSWLWGGIIVMVEQSLEVYFFDSPLWREVSKALYLFFTR